MKYLIYGVCFNKNKRKVLPNFKLFFLDQYNFYYCALL